MLKEDMHIYFLNDTYKTVEEKKVGPQKSYKKESIDSWSVGPLFEINVQRSLLPSLCSLKIAGTT